MAAEIVALVEGEGDQAAVPVLLRRLLRACAPPDVAPYWQPAQLPPLRVGSLIDVYARLDRLAGTLRILMTQENCRGALVLLDLDEEQQCPKAEAIKLARAFGAYGLPYAVVVVFARREYEEWLVASLESIAPRSLLFSDDTLRRDYPAESKRGVKEWLAKQTNPPYKATHHQAELTRHLDPDLARECRSFQRLEHAVAELVSFAARPEAERLGRVTPMAG